MKRSMPTDPGVSLPSVRARTRMVCGVKVRYSRNRSPTPTRHRPRSGHGLRPTPSFTTVEPPLLVTVTPARFSSQAWTSIITPASKGRQVGQRRGKEMRRRWGCLLVRAPGSLFFSALFHGPTPKPADRLGLPLAFPSNNEVLGSGQTRGFSRCKVTCFPW